VAAWVLGTWDAWLLGALALGRRRRRMDWAVGAWGAWDLAMGHGDRRLRLEVQGLDAGAWLLGSLRWSTNFQRF